MKLNEDQHSEFYRRVDFWAEALGCKSTMDKHWARSYFALAKEFVIECLEWEGFCIRCSLKKIWRLIQWRR